jgi:hypothetical protein
MSRSTAVVAWSALAAALTSACDPTYGVAGTVVDPRGVPIVGASVTMTCPKGPGDRAVTDAAGKFSFGGVGGSFEAGSCTLLFEAAGFRPLRLRTIDVCYHNTEDRPHRSWPCTPPRGKVTLAP